jgi:hypothetical protein
MHKVRVDLAFRYITNASISSFLPHDPPTMLECFLSKLFYDNLVGQIIALHLTAVNEGSNNNWWQFFEKSVSYAQAEYLYPLQSFDQTAQNKQDTHHSHHSFTFLRILLNNITSNKGLL